MADVQKSPSMSRKRSHDDTSLLLTPQAQTHANMNDSIPLAANSRSQVSPTSLRMQRHASPAVSSGSSSLTELSRDPPSSGVADGQPTKKRKLTFAEREVAKALRRQEKEGKERQKAEEKARKDEEKRVKDEEKRRREEEMEQARREGELEKAERQKSRDAERLVKEEEKRKKEEEKNRKERSQLRLGNFFSKSTVPSTPPPCSPEDASSGVSSRRLSIVCLGDGSNTDIVAIEPLTKSELSDYDRLFPAFFVHPHTELAPPNRLLSVKRMRTELDDLISVATPPTSSPPSIRDMLQDMCALSVRRSRSWQRNTFRQPKSVKEIIEKMDGSANDAIDLTDDGLFSGLHAMLNEISFKVFFFHDDIRPGYQGTFTRPVSPTKVKKLFKRPFEKFLPNINYDYDSEAEWEPPDPDDVDLEAAEDESGTEDDEEDMDGFLDDEDDMGKRRLIVGDVQPQSSGMCWQTEARETSFPNCSFDLRELRMQVIFETHDFPIDPHSRKYWSPAKSAPSSPRHPSSLTSSGTMPPPRLPLQALAQVYGMPNQRLLVPKSSRFASTGSENAKALQKIPPTQSTTEAHSSTPVKLISTELLPAFKQAVSGSDLNKVGLVEILKKQFPKVSKDVIRDTLSVVAVRQGAKEADKKWVLVDSV